MAAGVSLPAWRHDLDMGLGSPRRGLNGLFGLVHLSSSCHSGPLCSEKVRHDVMAPHSSTLLPE